jgi:hypothetical protein
MAVRETDFSIAALLNLPSASSSSYVASSSQRSLVEAEIADDVESTDTNLRLSNPETTIGLRRMRRGSETTDWAAPVMTTAVCEEGSRRLEAEPDSSTHSPTLPRPSTSSSFLNNSSDSPTATSRPHSLWTQRQRRGGGGGSSSGGAGRRPYSRGCVLALGWWYAHLPYLSTEEMETLGRLTALSRHQVKVWWQNRRHNQRGREIRQINVPPQQRRLQRSALLEDFSQQKGLPQALSARLGVPPPPHSPQRHQLFAYLLQFFCAYILPRLPPMTTSTAASWPLTDPSCFLREPASSCLWSLEQKPPAS